MDPLLLALLLGNLVLTLVVLVLVLVLARRGAGGASAAGGELRQDLSAQRSELGELLRRDREERQVAHRELRHDLDASRAEVAQRLLAEAEAARLRGEQLTQAVGVQLAALRQENEARLEKMRETVDEKLRTTLTVSLKENADRIEALTKANNDKQLELQAVLREELEKLRQGNEAKLEKMRETVDEKLQGTLEKRLGESFTLVSTRLEEVQKGLGEMQSLASDVGGLKRVLTNVKNRGGWGEVQLSRQLEDILTPDQYEENAAVRPGSAERVEFAVKMPGREEGGSPVFLPIDSKFPQEDYERLLDAQEAGEKTAIDEAGRAVERAIVEQAKTIAKKYIEPPHTTDFAILYLPTEGLFAEVVRRPGLASRLQTEHRILITGPTTLMSLLNSLQMGFRTLAIEKRSSEVWQVLAAAKNEFQKYGQVWSKLEKQLQTAQNTVSEAGRRTRAVERKLRTVESPPIGAGESLLDELGADPAEFISGEVDPGFESGDDADGTDTAEQTV
ncbi:MAG: DNA recombination protein RmuC [Leifsonia xyli]|nr:MAG: DNA recombination protein RmuC [Leifsonia xyli]